MAFSRSLRLAIQFFTYLTQAIFRRQLKSRSFRRIFLLPAMFVLWAQSMAERGGP